jgi:MoaA/NifB/PqqE/SkfB family radical SAM enzyme
VRTVVDAFAFSRNGSLAGASGALPNKKPVNPRLAVNLLGDRIAALPLAIVYVTDRCNSKCVTCDFWRYGQTNLPVERARWLAREFRGLGTQVVLLSGGEALLHPHWDEVAAAFQQQGQRLWLLTAGLSLKKHAARATELCERITVSLDGATPETYVAIRGVEAFEAVCSGVREAVGRGAWVSLRCTLQRSNYREMPDLIRLARDLGVKQVSFLAVDVSTHVAFARQEDYERTMALTPGDLPEFDSVLDSVDREFAPEFASGFIAESPAKLRRLRQYFAALVGQAEFPPVRCNAPRYSAVVGADGHLQP